MQGLSREEFCDLVVTELRAIWGQETEDQFPTLGEGDNFFEVGVIDSLGILELISYLENRFDRTIDLLEVDPEKFFTLSGLYARFVE